MKNKMQILKDLNGDILWEGIWDEIYEFQKTLPNNSLPEDEDKLKKMGLYLTIGRSGEKVYINKELSKKLYYFRCSR